MSDLSKSNTLRHAELIDALRKVTIYDLDGAHADNVNEMSHRHHAIISAVADYFQAEINALNYAAGTTLHAKSISSMLDATFSDFIAPEYREQRTWLREEEGFRADPRNEHRIGCFEAGIGRAA